MSKPLREAPAVPFDEEDVWSGRFPQVLARQAQEHGPIFRRVVPTGPNEGFEAIFLVGPEANKLVLHTHRDAFSHDKGWTPMIGDMMGRDHNKSQVPIKVLSPPLPSWFTSPQSSDG
jgi:hypothetical protein